MILIRSIDTETTGKVRADGAQICEIGWTDIWLEPATKAVTIGEPRSLHFDVVGPMPPDTQAVHHISKAMLGGQPICESLDLQAIATCETPYSFGEGGPAFLVAHNADFERQWFTPDACGPAKWIDTFKAALRAFPDAPAHNNQTLRYFLQVDLDAGLADPPHRAAPDSYVTAHILAALLQTITGAQMEAWTRMPRFYATCPLKKHRGQPWSTVPFDYLQWIVRQPDMEADIKATAQDEMSARAASRR